MKILRLTIKIFWSLAQLIVYCFGSICLGGLLVAVFFQLKKYDFGLWTWLSLWLASGMLTFIVWLLKEAIIRKIGEERINAFKNKYDKIIFFYVCLFSLIIFSFLSLNGFFNGIYD